MTEDINIVREMILTGKLKGDVCRMAADWLERHSIEAVKNKTYDISSLIASNNRLKARFDEKSLDCQTNIDQLGESTELQK